MAAVDQELKKAFTDLQVQVVSTRDKVGQFQREIDVMIRATAGMKITNKTLETLGTEHRTFESVGRTFVLREPTTLRAKITKMVEENEAKVKGLESNKKYQLGKQKESEDHLRELLSKKKYGG